MSYFTHFADISKKFLIMKNTVSRKKRYATKGKTGCITCRIRRVKCDEDKPSCHRCVSSGRKCDGYDLTPLVSSGKILQPIVSGGSDPESQAIYQFRTRIATLIASSFDANFWTYDVLHTSDRYVPVRHALAALASAYQKSILLGIESKSCDMFIFSQYQKAMKSLSICFQEPKVLSTSAKLAALVANFLFTYLCSLQGLRQEALVHLRNGLALIHEWGDLRGQGQHVLTDILGLYMRLDTQTRVISTTDSTSHYLGGRSRRGTLQGTSGTPSVCSLLRQLDAIHGQILQPSNVQASISSTEYSLRLWDRRFENPSVTSQEERKHMTALRMRRIMVEVTLDLASNRSNNAEMTVDKNCKAILDLAVQLMQDLGLRPAQAGFYLANGLIEALYFVAITSEDWDLRHQAIQVLRQYRFTDGVWGSNAAADLAEGRLQGDIYRYREQLEA